MAKTAPAYSYYPDAFEQGTATMTLAEVGGYQRLLNHQWATGAVPGDQPKQIAAILRCTVRTAATIWAVVGQKFVRDDQGLWRNARMERERLKQQRRLAALATNGAHGGRPKSDNQNESYRFSENVQNRHESDNQNESLPSPSPSPVRTKKQDLVGVVPQKATTTTAPPLVMSPLQHAKALQTHVFVGARLKVPNKLHDDFRRLLGGTDPDQRLLPWYHAIDAEIERSGEPIVPDVFKWLEARFRVWASSTANDAAMRAWVEAG